MDWFEVLLKAAGVVVVAGGGAAALIFGPLRYLADKWLTSKFNQRFEQFKHAQQVELENLRFKINSLFDRTTKLHQREFEVVPAAWALLVECKNQVTALIAGFQQYPNLDRMTAPQLDEFLEGSFLAKWQRDELKASAKKTDYYMDAVFYHRYDQARAACREAHVYVLKNGIFMPSDMKAKFDKMSDLVWKVLVEHQINHSDKPVPRLKEARDALSNEAEALMKTLEEAIHGGLRDGHIASLKALA
ncbi:hypothetical protein [Bradyrhizobium sp. RT10b]|uniref:hypothetical protein n=1 Tax=Bradyrhizobium sp. RT10b TaxID=3156331 RepID=UPI003392A7E3